MNFFKTIIKRFWIVILLAVIINVPILVIGTYRTDKTITLKGDTTNIKSLVEVDNEYAEEGSFSSIYVISMDHSTILQNMICDLSLTTDVDDLSDYYLHFTDSETYQMGQVQKNSSIQTSIITAFNYAKSLNEKVYIDYKFKSLCVSFYFEGSPFKIKDEIIKINDIDVTAGRDEFVKQILSSKENDLVTVLRDEQEINIKLSKNAYQLMRFYEYYDINYDTIFPKITVNKSSSGGPSGGLLQTLSILNRLTEMDYSKGLKISGTGTMSVSFNVGAIGGIKQKIYTAYDDNVDIFFCPEKNDEEALIAYNNLKKKEKMKLVSVKTLADAVSYLENV